MFDIGASELLLVIIVAVVVIGPKDLPLAMRTAGRWIGRMRRISNHFRSGIEAMIREAELEEMEQKWRDHNAAIMAQDAAEQTPEAAADQHHMEPLPVPTDSTVQAVHNGTDAAHGGTEAPPADAKPEPGAP